MREISSADATKVSESSTKTVLRPNATATAPPIAAPSAKLIDQVVAASAFAMAMFSPETMLGITARLPGSNNAQHTVSRNNSVNSSHSDSRERTSIIASTIPARAQSAKIMIFLRLMRSLSTPAIGDEITCGSTCIMNA